MARFRQSGVRTSATQKDKTASMSSEYTAAITEDRIQKSKSKKAKT
jgi:hypothetical protein